MNRSKKEIPLEKLLSTMEEVERIQQLREKEKQEPYDYQQMKETLQALYEKERVIIDPGVIDEAIKNSLRLEKSKSQLVNLAKLNKEKDAEAKKQTIKDAIYLVIFFVVITVVGLILALKFYDVFATYLLPTIVVLTIFFLTKETFDSAK